MFSITIHIKDLSNILKSKMFSILWNWLITFKITCLSALSIIRKLFHSEPQLLEFCFFSYYFSRLNLKHTVCWEILSAPQQTVSFLKKILELLFNLSQIDFSLKNILMRASWKNGWMSWGLLCKVWLLRYILGSMIHISIGSPSPHELEEVK